MKICETCAFERAHNIPDSSRLTHGECSFCNAPRWVGDYVEEAEPLQPAQDHDGGVEVVVQLRGAKTL